MTASRRVIAAGLLIYGAPMIAGGMAAYTSPVYEVVFDLAAGVSPSWADPTLVWGVGFCVAGAAALIPHDRDFDPGAFLMLALVGSWSIGLWIAVLGDSRHTWGGPIWPTLVAILVFLHIGRRHVR